MSIAARLARAEPGEVVLVVTVELCTLAFRGRSGDKADVIAAALFGDGAAAVVLRADAEQASLSIGATAEHTWPGTLDIMGWSVDPVGFGVVLSRSLPRFVEQLWRRRAPLYRRRAARSAPPDLPSGRHQGARGYRDRARTANGTLRDERDVLRGHGNMSAPSVLFVLERALKRGLSGQSVLAALGPGFTASFLALEAAHG